jgi:hypothetical protein
MEELMGDDRNRNELKRGNAAEPGAKRTAAGGYLTEQRPDVAERA